jgi:hypothetical protein
MATPGASATTPPRARSGRLAGVVAGVLLLAFTGAGTAGAVGTTVTPGEAVFNVAISATTTAQVITPLGTVSCSESRSRGAVPAAPGNAEREESGTVQLAFEPPTFGTCSFPGASSATVRATGEWSSTAAGYGEESSDMLAVAVPEESLTITIVNSHGTCTIVAPNGPSAMMGEWTDGTGGGASRTTLEGQFEFTSSGTCIAHCMALEGTGSLNAQVSYDVTNAAERGESIRF